MNVDIRVEYGRAEVWTERIQRQLDFKLAGLEHRVSALEVTIARLSGPVDGFECAMRATLENGDERFSLTRGSYPHICLADAASRLAREITRTVTLAPSRITATG